MHFGSSELAILTAVLVRANMEAEEMDKLSDEEIRGQMSCV